MGCILELVWWSFGDIILRRTGDAILYAATLGRHKPGEDDEWPPYVAGGLFWLLVIGALVYFAVPIRRR